MRLDGYTGKWLGVAIRTRRRKVGWTLEELSNALKGRAGAKYLAKLEEGNLDWISRDILEPIAKMLVILRSRSGLVQTSVSASLDSMDEYLTGLSDLGLVGLICEGIEPPGQTQLGNVPEQKSAGSGSAGKRKTSQSFSVTTHHWSCRLMSDPTAEQCSACKQRFACYFQNAP